MICGLMLRSKKDNEQCADVHLKLTPEWDEYILYRIGIGGKRFSRGYANKQNTLGRPKRRPENAGPILF